MNLFKSPTAVLIAILLSVIDLNAQLCIPNPELPQPTMTCLNAPFICELQDYCSVLPHDDEFPDVFVAGCPQFSALNNPAFFSFIATANTVAITLVYENCTLQQGASSGIQVAILHQCPQPNGLMQAVPGTCWQNCVATEGNTTIMSSFFEVGKQYFFLIDGCAGSTCDFQIVNVFGADFPSLETDTIDSDDLTGPLLVCPGQTFSVSLNKPMNASTYAWNSPFIGDFNTSEQDATISVPAQTPPGSYTVCLLDAYNPCAESLTKYGYTGNACFTFEVETIPETELGPFNICLGDSYTADGQTFTPSDTGLFNATYQLTSSTGCDSTIHLTLNVTGVDNEITWAENMLTATQADAVYQWVDCGNGGTPIDSATSQSFVPEESGSYQVIIQKDGCVVYSQCLEVLILSNGFTLVNNPTFFYPNPANDFLHFELNSNARIIVHNIQGSVLIENDFSAGKQFLDIANLKSGTYIAKVYLQDKVIVQKIIIQR